jgi:glycosyltransferase involved in cell wall biosynthesis
MFELSVKMHKELIESTNMPRVSVIIPAYNSDRYVVEAIESVLNQDYTDYEIIVVNDGSTDRTRQVLEPYFDRIRYLYQQNQGVSAARNYGIREAKGEFVALLDADDLFLPQKLSAQVACFESDPTLGMVHSGWQLIDEQNEQVLSKHEPWIILPKLDLETWLLWRPVFPGAMMFRRQWLEQVGGFDLRFPPVEDVALILQLAAIDCCSGWLPQITVSYRQHDASATTQNTSKQARSFDAVYNYFFSQKNLPEQGRQLEKAARYNYLVWLGWRLLHTGHFNKMVEYLQEAIPYTPFLSTETIANWIQLFHNYSKGSGERLDIYWLGNLPEWKQVMQQLLLVKIPRVSVIIPAYNCDRYIQQAVESVLDQTYSDYEIIVINDGSTDQTAEALQPYCDRIRYYYQENQGAGLARNRAMRLARGKLIAFLDADDFFLPDKLVTQVARFDADPPLGLVQSGWRTVDQDGVVISDVQPWEYLPNLDLEAFFMHKPVRPSAMMVRREWCEHIGGFGSSTLFAEDLDFALRLALHGCKAAWIQEIHACYRQHDSNSMSSGYRVIRDVETILEQFLNRPDIPSYIHQLKQQERYQRFVWFAWRMYRDGYLGAMVECLEESILTSPFSSTETILNWIQNFRIFSIEYGYKLDSYSLVSLEEWQQATDCLLTARRN